MSMKRDLEFLFEMGTLRFIKRAWVQVLSPEFGNLSEHIFRVAWIAMILAKREKVKNLEKILKMALVHDIAESRTGDVHYISRQYTKRSEELAMKDMLHETSLPDLEHTWLEYERRECIEAKIVKDADNLDVDMDLLEQEARGSNLRKIFKKHRSQAAFNSLYTKSAREMWKAIQKSNPHDWHLNGRNRFNAGDWAKFNKRKKK
jgi:putative hydrolases of HD superfamily